ncbi:hypothetical protein ABZX77_28445 [Streptomyces sp. NPDC004237]|uniref:hypothetical protein n=1 Tax=Streptomyces sp. NPDC004237 TaxID=3154455 RepID=UPI0033B64C54
MATSAAWAAGQAWLPMPRKSAAVANSRYVRYSLSLPDLTALGTDLLAAVLR